MRACLCFLPSLHFFVFFALLLFFIFIFFGYGFLLLVRGFCWGFGCVRKIWDFLFFIVLAFV